MFLVISSVSNRQAPGRRKCLERFDVLLHDERSGHGRPQLLPDVMRIAGRLHMLFECQRSGEDVRDQPKTIHHVRMPVPFAAQCDEVQDPDHLTSDF
jgi:hypothetical protein